MTTQSVSGPFGSNPLKTVQKLIGFGETGGYQLFYERISRRE